MDEHVCTCREWQLSGKPCPHALSVITAERQPDMEKYVHVAYSVHKFQAAYAGLIPVITDKSQWPKVKKGFKLEPPISKPRGLGRYRKSRMKSSLETGAKATRQVTCKACGELGHRSTSWRCPLSGTKKRYVTTIQFNYAQNYYISPFISMQEEDQKDKGPKRAYKRGEEGH